MLGCCCCCCCITALSRSLLQYWLLGRLTPCVNTTALHHASKKTDLNPKFQQSSACRLNALNRTTAGIDYVSDMLK